MIRKFLVLILIMLLWPGLGALSASSGAESFYAALKEIAVSEKINLIVAAQDQVGSFVINAGEDPEAAIDRTAAAADCRAARIGASFVIVPRQAFAKIERTGISLYRSQYLPVEQLLAEVSDRPEALATTVSAANLAILSGFKKERQELEKKISAKDIYRPTCRIDFSCFEGDARIASLSFATIAGVPARITIVDENDRTLYLLLTAETDEHANVSLSGSFAQQARSGKLAPDFEKRFIAAKPEAETFLCEVGGRKITGICRAVVCRNQAPEVSPAKSRKPQKIPNRSLDEVFDGDEEINDDAEKPEFMSLELINEPVEEVFAGIAASASSNLVCHEEVAGRITVFAYGPELYFEEFFGLVARPFGLSLRKIGNTFRIFPENKQQDIFERGLYLTQRLRYADAGDMLPLLEKVATELFPHQKMPISCDNRINALVYGGKADWISHARKIISAIDKPPLFLQLKTDATFAGKLMSSESLLPLGQNYSFSFEHGAARIELLPVSCISGAEVKYSASIIRANESVLLESWIKPEAGDDFSFFVDYKNRTLSGKFLLEAISSDLLSEEESENKFENDFSPDTEFDNAFDQSF